MCGLRRNHRVSRVYSPLGSYTRRSVSKPAAQPSSTVALLLTPPLTMPKRKKHKDDDDEFDEDVGREWVPTQRILSRTLQFDADAPGMSQQVRQQYVVLDFPTAVATPIPDELTLSNASNLSFGHFDDFRWCEGDELPLMLDDDDLVTAVANASAGSGGTNTVVEAQAKKKREHVSVSFR